MHSAPAAAGLVASVQQHAQAPREVAGITVKVIGTPAEEAGEARIHPQIAIDSGGAVNHQPEPPSAYVTASTRRAATGGAT